MPQSRPVQLLGIPDGSEGVRATLEIMRKLALEGRTSGAVRETALGITAALPDEAFGAEIEALHSYVRDAIRYVQDVNEVETVQTPEATLELQAGDCDDKSVLLAAMLESLGHPARFVAVAFAPDAFEHVYVETRLGPRWIALEATKPVPAGWAPEGVVSRMVRHL